MRGCPRRSWPLRIEGKERDPVRRCLDGRTEGVEISDTGVLDDHLAID